MLVNDLSFNRTKTQYQGWWEQWSHTRQKHHPWKKRITFQLSVQETTAIARIKPCMSQFERWLLQSTIIAWHVVNNVHVDNLAKRNDKKKHKTTDSYQPNREHTNKRPWQPKHIDSTPNICQQRVWKKCQTSDAPLHCGRERMPSSLNFQSDTCRLLWTIHDKLQNRWKNKVWTCTFSKWWRWRNKKMH